MLEARGRSQGTKGTNMKTQINRIRRKANALFLFMVAVLGWAGTTCGAGRYVQVDYPASTVPGEMIIAVTYTL
jgi:hypothetical protein